MTLVKFNDASKIKLIKKIKEVMEGLNLVQVMSCNNESKEIYCNSNWFFNNFSDPYA